jgi:GNAT superfamily N-acetyltransferase
VSARKRSAERPDGSPDFVFEVVDPLSDLAVEAVSRYVAELDSRFDGGFDPGDVTVGAEAYTPPDGLFVVVRAEADGALAGCGAVQRLDDQTAEIKRMWVNPDFRGHGLGRRILTHLEDQAGQLGHGRVVLDTNGTLREAIALYQRTGYHAIERYNDNPYAQHWFAKALDP